MKKYMCDKGNALRCDCYCHKQGWGRSAEIKRLAGNSKGEHIIESNELAIVMTGGLSVRLAGSHIEKFLNTRAIVFMPMGTKFEYRSADGADILVLRVTGNMPECHCFKIENTLQETTYVRKHEPEIFSLMANDCVMRFAEALKIAFDNGVTCSQFLNMKVSEIFYIIRAHYTEDDCMKLFVHISTSEMEFTEFLKTNSLKYKTIGELAAALGMTVSGFTSKFKKIYNNTPSEWLRRKKEQCIYREICYSDKQFKRISLEYNFSTQSHFVRYCHKTFGKSPGKLREEIHYANKTI